MPGRNTSINRVAGAPPDDERQNPNQVIPTLAPTVVLPQPRPGGAGDGGKSVQDLHRLIEEAMVLLAREPETQAAPPEITDAPAVPVLGAAPGSQVRHSSSLKRRIAKTIAGLAALLVVGLVPLKHLLTSSSTEAIVNAPLYDVRAPIDGRLVSDKLTPGTDVERNEELALIMEGPGFARATPVAATHSGKVWEVLVPPGHEVARGQEIARIAACSVASVTATVSETVYDKLEPGMPVRFSFYGADRSYSGLVANLLGHAALTSDFAISPGSLTGDAFRVIVTVPALGVTPSCPVGRRGEVIFDPPGG